VRFLADKVESESLITITISGAGQVRRHTIEVKGPEDAKKIGDALTAYVLAVRRLRMTAAREPAFPGPPWWDR
jgi:hypothetical protein